MSVYVRGTAPDAYEARIAEMFILEYDQEPQHYPDLFNIVPSTRAYEDWFEVSGLGTLRLKPEGTPITYDIPVQGPRRRVVHSTFGLGFQVTKEAKADEQFEVIDQQARDLGASAREHQDILAFGAVNDFFTGTIYNVADTGTNTKAVVDTAHYIMKPKTAGATASNKVNPGVALGVTGLEAGITLMRLTKTREDRYTNMRAEILLVHPSLDHRAYELLNSEFKIDSQDNNKSTVATSRTGMRPMSVPYLSSTDDWFLFANKSKHKLTWHNREAVTMDTSGRDYQTKNTMVDAMYRASVAVKDWRGIVGIDV